MIKSVDNILMLIMPISEQDLFRAQWQLHTKAQSYEFGRRLYQIRSADACFWLKFQIRGFNIDTQAAFEHELACYQRFEQPELLLPQQIIELKTTPETECSTGKGLLLVHADEFLTQPGSAFTWSEITDKIMAVLQCLSAWQKLGWVHGDLKHEHIVEYHGQCYFFDLEQSRKVDAAVVPAVCSTPRYMAPELFQGAKKTLQTDLYALGIVLWEWLCGQSVGSLSYREWGEWHAEQPIPRLPPQYRSLQALLNGLLAKRGSHRFVCAEDAVKLLQHQLSLQI